MSEQILGPEGSKPPKHAAEAEEERQPDPAALVAAAMREMAEPKDGIAPTPVWLMLFFFVLAGWSGYYIANNAGAFRSDVYNEHFTQGGAAPEKAPPADPTVLGRQTFNVCMQCHQDTGKGLPGTYPPLVGSPIVLGDPATPIRILLHGLQGDVTVEGATYNGQMPSWDRFSDEQIAAVLTYVRGAWTNQASAVDPKLVAAIRQQTTARGLPWTWPELEVAAKTPVNVAPAAPPAAASLAPARAGAKPLAK
jgi:mono/diheme cytochrome c family protein